MFSLGAALFYNCFFMAYTFDLEILLAYVPSPHTGVLPGPLSVMGFWSWSLLSVLSLRFPFQSYDALAVVENQRFPII